jgi:multicomponent Na+:H+ antiporter subunit A
MPLRFFAGIFAGTPTKDTKFSELKFHAPESILYLPLMTLGALSIFGALVWSSLGAAELTRLHNSLTLTWSAFGKHLLELGLVTTLYWVLWAGPLRDLFQKVSTSPLIHALRKTPGHELFQAAWDTFLKLARSIRQISQPGSMRSYLMTVLLALLALWSLATIGAARFLETNAAANIPSTAPLSVSWIFIIGSLCLTALVGLVLCLRSKNSLQAIIGLSLVGFSVAGLFSVSGAPDLAMTQFAVECLSLILFFAVLRKLPTFKKEKRPRRALLDALVASGFGLVFFATLYLATQSQALSRLTPFFAERSLSEGHGRNVVNVILVDFRGFDTMGEISVLAIAGLSIAALLERAMRRRKEGSL